MDEDEKDLESRDGTEGTETSEAELEGQTTETEREAGDTGDDGDGGKLPVGVTKRLSKLTAQRTRAERERDAALARVAAYEAKEREREDRRRREQEATPEGQTRLQRRQQVRSALDEGFGDGFSEELERERQERQEERDRQKEQYALNGVTYLRSELEDHGLVVDDRALVRWERAVGSELQEDRELFAMFRRPATQQKAIQEAFERVRDGLVNPVVKAGRPLARIERNRGALLGGRRGVEDTAESQFPEDYTAKPPKGATADEEAAFWRDHRDKMWTKLGEHRPTSA